jgi:hypothetical protein
MMTENGAPTDLFKRLADLHPELGQLILEASQQRGGPEKLLAAIKDIFPGNADIAEWAAKLFAIN